MERTKALIWNLVGGLALLLSSLSFAGSYDRSAFNFKSYKASTSVGFYTNQLCDFINIDHVVSLKDAYESGASLWGDSRKEAFANDRSTMCRHVPE